jgi:hypothetical protein
MDECCDCYKEKKRWWISSQHCTLQDPPPSTKRSLLMHCDKSWVSASFLLRSNHATLIHILSAVVFLNGPIQLRDTSVGAAKLCLSCIQQSSYKIKINNIIIKWTTSNSYIKPNEGHYFLLHVLHPLWELFYIDEIDHWHISYFDSKVQIFTNY